MRTVNAIFATYRLVQMVRGKRPATFRDTRMLIRIIELGDRQRDGAAAVMGESFVQRIMDKRRRRRMAVWSATGIPS